MIINSTIEKIGKSNENRFVPAWFSRDNWESDFHRFKSHDYESHEVISKLESCCRQICKSLKERSTFKERLR